MIYVPPDVHRAMRELALQEDCPASDIYVEAARRHLATRLDRFGATTVSDRARLPGPDPATAELTSAVQALSGRIDEMLGDEAPPRARADGAAGTKATQAMREILVALRQAGTIGIASRELSSLLRSRGVRSGTADIAKATLRSAGIVTSRDRRLYLSMPG